MEVRIMIEKTLTKVATKKKKVYKNPAPVKFVQIENKFQGLCTFCGAQIGWSTNPPCGKG